MSAVKKRFIAGAVCPQCKLEDKICLCIEENDEAILCVNCGYEERKSQLTKPEHLPEPIKEQIIHWLPKKTKTN